jgi:hypothetical protein
MYQILRVVFFVIDGFFGLDEGSRFFLWIICRRKAGQDAPPTGDGGALRGKMPRLRGVVVIRGRARCPAYGGWCFAF